MFPLNLSFVASNVSRVSLHFYHKRLSPFRPRTALGVRLAIFPLGRKGLPQRNVQYLTISNLTLPGWTSVDFTQVINNLLKPARRASQLSVALQFELHQRNGK